jgi:predicted porin
LIGFVFESGKSIAESLLAVAVAAALPVVAQAQVTLSGRIDTAVVSQKSATNGISATGLSSGTLTTNQIVLQGSEDLTGGMKANFIINSQFSSDEKAALDWGHRGIAVGLSGGFGAVDLGRSTCTTLCSIEASGLIGNLGNMSTTLHTTRPDNSITYTTPSMSGLRLKVIHGLNESKNSTTAVTGKEVTEFAALYAAGPLDVMVAYVDEKGTANQYLEAGWGASNVSGAVTGAPVAPSTTPAGLVTGLGVPTATGRPLVGPGKHSGFRVNYNAGFATLHVRWQDVDLTAAGADTTEYGLGAQIPLGGDRTAFVDYRVFNPEKASSDSTRISAAIAQNLSKRTNLYAAVWSDKYDAKVLTGTSKRYDGTAFAVGVRHSF